MILSRCHLQRLPLNSIVRTHVVGKVVFDKNPCLAGLRAGQQTQLGAAAYFLWVHMEEGGGLVQIEGMHVVTGPSRSQ